MLTAILGFMKSLALQVKEEEEKKDPRPYPAQLVKEERWVLLILLGP